MKLLTGPFRSVVVVLLAVVSGYVLTLVALTALSGIGLPSGIEITLFWLLVTVGSAFLWHRVLPKLAKQEPTT